VPIVLKSGSLNLLELSGPVKDFNGITLHLPYYKCQYVTVLHSTDHFESTTLSTAKTPEDGILGVPKHLGGNFIHLLCINSSACMVGYYKLVSAFCTVGIILKLCSVSPAGSFQ
jgi:hypothetical protein